jgi:hypothetical protein
MEFINYLAVTVLYLASLAFDIAAFFLLIRTVKYRWNPGWIDAFDRAGKALTDGWLDRLEKTAKSRFKKTLSTRELFIYSCVIMFIAQLFLNLCIGILAN